MSKLRNDIFLGRQPIVDRRQHLVAYELLYRSGRMATAEVRDDAAATAEVMRQAFRRIGIDTVLGECAGFVNVDAEMLFSRRVEALPTDRVVLELLETVVVDERIVSRCRELKRRGFRLALDDFYACSERYEPLLEFADIVKIDVPQLDPESLAALVEKLKLYPGRLLAEKVESWERARECLALGFDLFQGFVFARPSILQSQS